jgi:hypothetical protein
VPCELTAYQFDLLLVLARHAGRVLSRDALMDLLKGEPLEAFDRSIDVHMSRIRAAVEDDPKNRAASSPCAAPAICSPRCKTDGALQHGPSAPLLPLLRRAAVHPGAVHLAVVMIWNRTGSPLERSNNTLAQVMQNVLAPIDAPPEVQQAALARVAAGLNAHMTLYTRDWRPLAVVGEQIPARHWRRQGVTGPPPESFVRLPDGRKLLSSEPLGFTRPKAMLHNALLLLAIGLAWRPSRWCAT